MNPNYTNERGTHRNQPPLQQTYGNSPASGPAPSTAGHHHHDILNKLDPRVDSTHDNQTMPSQTQPVHSSKLANTLDPRVDSRSANAQLQAQQQQQPVMHGANHYGSSGGGMKEGTYGPHSSRVGNAMDPRVDSDLDSRGMRTGNAVGGGYTPGMMESGMTGRNAGGTHGMMGSTGGSHGVMGSTAGSHGGVMGSTGGGMGTHGIGHQSMQRGPLPGPAPNTAGPHKSDLLNKLDPTVDSKGGLGHTGTGTYRGDDVRRGI
ncbi:hypothetical protein QBC38DRAFT_488367 [Podospora fimiseda]|uniref:Uncharacterized protein n=1 Tax=Podospora fimiseda TaxID=252190 RepID=A0AAN7BGZ6_9PEZI|nr:hypothetical protein QBC38DRAFT_488367 [Podospora fimiseda]